MKVKESEKAGLKLNIQNSRIMTYSPITSWQIEGENVRTVSDFILLGTKIAEDDDYSHEMKRRVLLGRIAITDLDSVLKSRDITYTKVCIVMYGCGSWTIKKVECPWIDAFEL